MRALSPGINDPNTAISVIDRLGEALCDIAPLHLPTGVYERDGSPVLVVRAVDYDGLTDTMFHMIRQNARGKPAVLIRLLDVLTTVAKLRARFPPHEHAAAACRSGDRRCEARHFHASRSCRRSAAV